MQYLLHRSILPVLIKQQLLFNPDVLYLNMPFKKIRKPVPVTIPTPGDSISFFQDFKIASELYWDTVELKKEVYGFQIQAGSKWRKGLTHAELSEFEKAVGFSLCVTRI